jgi:protease IV
VPFSQSGQARQPAASSAALARLGYLTYKRCVPVRLLINLLVNLWILLANVPRIFRAGRGPRWVRIDLTEPLPSRPAHRRLFAPRRGSLAALSTTIDQLAADPRLTGVVFRLEHLAGGWARAQTVRGLIERLRKAGKRPVVHLSSPGLREYYVACAAESIVCDESGPLGLVGIAAEATFFGGALAKAGVRAEAEYRGAYKSFAETFTRDDMSPAHREALDAILDAAAAEVKGAIARGRGVDEAGAEAIMTGGPYEAGDAAARRIVDAVRYLDEVPAWLGEKGERVPSVREWQGARWKPFRWRPLFRGPRRVRVVSLHGGIVGGEGSEFPRRTLGGDAAARVLEGARKDRRVGAVVLHVDSRGGSAAASDRIWRETVRLAREKPVVAYFDDVAASGGYYLACAATKIVAQPGTLTGSIGVVAGKLSLAGLYEKIGLRSIALTRGDAAAMFSVARGFSTEERARLAAEVDAMYRQFVRKVADGRRLSPEAAEAAAQGRVWAGVHARERGLVDELGDVDRAIELAKELARTARRRPDEKLVVEDVHPAPRRRALLGRLLSSEGVEVPAPLGELYDLASLSGERAWLVSDLLIRWW